MNNSTAIGINVPSNGASECAMLLLMLGELIGHLLLECPFSALNLYLIWTTSVLHRNLKFILISQSVCIFARGAIRSCAILPLLLLNANFGRIGEQILTGIYLFPMNLRNHIPHIMVIERFMATLFVKDYEKWQSPCFTIAWAFATAFLSVICSIEEAKRWHSTGFRLISSSILLVSCAVETVAFFWLCFCNSKKYRLTFEDQRKHELSERYQLAENIRTTRQLAPTLLLHLFNLSIVTGGLLLYQYYYEFAGTSATSYSSSLVMQVQLILITYTNFLIELTILIKHPFLQHKLKWIYQKYVKSCARSNHRVGDEMKREMGENCQRHQPNGTDQRRPPLPQQKGSVIGLTDMSGKAMALSQNQAAYFDQLRKYWN
ncbi:hypothetical protein niasHS_012290 [Heterodera schachtii]|uniref:Gustatory receptor n=1 Tax=Heterodera schachtii TaxID=97005 RepID=A0ABD2IUL0_HETSC